jgi:hypothetical protein
MFIKFILNPIYCIRYLKNDLFSFFGIRYGGTNILFITGFPKSGTTWVESFISNIPGYNLRELCGNQEIIRHHNLPENAFKYFPKLGFSSIKTHINPNSENISILKKQNIKKILVMYRDPRDIAVSNYYHVLKKNPWMKTDKFYMDYKNVSKEEGLLHSLKLVVEEFPLWVNGWFKLAKISKDIDFYFLSYEKLRNNQADTFQDILDFFEVNLSKKEIKNIMKKISKHPKKFNAGRYNYWYKSTFRRGEIGDWKWEFEIDNRLNYIAKNNLKKILKKLDYTIS